jgi:hypothetical protein
VITDSRAAQSEQLAFYLLIHCIITLIKTMRRDPVRHCDTGRHAMLDATLPTNDKALNLNLLHMKDTYMHVHVCCRGAES